jgi:hypothetical protein
MNAEGIAMIGTVLLYGSAPLFLCYFFLFQRTIASLDEAERRRLKDVALPPWRRILALAPLAIAVFVDDLSVRSIAVLWVVVQLFFDTRDHHRRLAAAGFCSSFINRLSRISILAGVAMLAFVSGISLRGGLLPNPPLQPTDSGSSARGVRS